MGTNQNSLGAAGSELGRTDSAEFESFVTRTRGEGGMATVLMAAILGGVLILVGAVAIVVDIAHTKSRAATAADLAALAAANELLLGEPCAQASKVARANGASLTSCEIQGEDVQVVTQTAMAGALRSIFSGVRASSPKMTAVSRAGPPACDSNLNSLGIPC